MKNWVLSKIVFILLSLLIITEAQSQTEPYDYRAVSLSILQEKLNASHGKGTYAKELLRLTGLTRVIGYIVDEANNDLILFGEIERGLPSLYLDDLVIALRNIWLKYAELKGDTHYYLAPYCSIEPDFRAVESLKDIGRQIFEGSSSSSVERAIKKWGELCRWPQSVRIMGIPHNSHFASVIVKADYDMKRLAIGCDSVDIPEFSSLSDMTLEKAQRDFIDGGATSLGSSIGNRFWFYPGEINFLEDEGIITIEECQIVLLTEESYLSKSGKIVGEGKTSEIAESFAERFTSMYADLAEEKPVYIEFENLFNIFGLSKCIKFKSSHEEAKIDLGYLLDKCHVTRTTVKKYLPGQSNVEKFERSSEIQGGRQTRKVWIPFCGGVAMNIKVGKKNFRWDKTGKLSRLRKKALKARPSPKTLFWNFRY